MLYPRLTQLILQVPALRALTAAAVVFALSASALQNNVRQPDTNVASTDPTFAADSLATVASTSPTLSSPETHTISAANKVRSTALSLAEPDPRGAEILADVHQEIR
jgi:hypothetical protein